ncbi:MAG: PKD domain-containing protein, partial [Flavobacteriales bacterium]|nr:PKD domain-containing protein [Flavobacteriales bacterium]
MGSSLSAASCALAGRGARLTINSAGIFNPIFIIVGCSPRRLFRGLNFIDLSTNNPTSWSWNFGNGNTSVAQNPSAVYTDTGTYTVTLVVTNVDGSDSVAKVNYITVFESPVSNFTSDITNGCSLTVQYADSSPPGSSAITSWFWDFGDGSSSTTQSPAYTYSMAGSYYVGLTVTNSDGCTNTVLINNYAAVSEGPKPGFTSSTQTGCSIPFAVNFSDTSAQGSSAITGWLWNFGDATLSTVQNPTHTFTSFGGFDITLTITDLDNCLDSLTVSNNIIIDDFQANFSSDTIVNCPDLQVNFADSSSPNPISWLWDFGNGASDTVQNPVNVYDSSGVYTVSLITTNAIGCTDTIIKSNYIDFEQPVASFVADSMDNCEFPFTVNFTNNSTGVGPLSYYWDFDDGSPVDTNANPSHTYNDTGIFKVSLIVKDAFGCTDTLSMAELTDSIVVWMPYSNYYSSPRSGCIPLQVDFINYSGSWIGTITDYDWNFGDPLSGVNNTSTLITPTHTYDSVGDYAITLIVTTDRGCKDTTTTADFIKAGYLPDTVYFSKAQDTACYGAPVQLTDLSVDTINKWWWTFDDGQGADLQNPNHAFQDTGWLMITLVADFNGCKDTSLADSIFILPPKASFGTNPASAWIMCSIPDTVSFVDYSWKAESWLWDFGDGSSQVTTQNPTHIYTDSTTAYIPVTLIASNSNGCIDTIIIDMANPYIKNGFFADDTTGCFTMDVSFTDTSTANMTIVNWLWTFGDGDSSGSAIPSLHTYSDTGQYDVALVTTSYQCTDTVTKKVFITVNGVFPEFAADILTGCLPLTVSFSDSSTGTSPVVSWSWDFGDSSAFDTTQYPTHTYYDTGFYDVQLIVIDSNGCMDTIRKNNYVRPTFPYPEFSYSMNACIGESINITNTSVGIGLNYSWDFGDGFTDSILNPVYSYADSGSFTITLTATDTNGCDSTVSQVISVIPFPVADFFVDTVITDCPPLVVTFSDLSTAIGDSITSWYWDFGDSSTATAQNPVHTFSYPDTFDVTLVITNSTGCSDTIVYPNLIFVGGPYGTFTFSPDSGCVPQDVAFSASAINTVNYQWDYGDGIIDTLITDSAVHMYSQPGNPTPSLLLIDSSGCVQLAAAPSLGSITI